MQACTASGLGRIIKVAGSEYEPAQRTAGKPQVIDGAIV